MQDAGEGFSTQSSHNRAYLGPGLQFQNNSKNTKVTCRVALYWRKQ